MRYGIHLPQYGRAASGDAIARAARQAEVLGFADAWVSDHIVFPEGQSYPSPYLFDPLATLTWAGAATTTLGLGTSVLVVSQRNPLELANQLASMDVLTGGRLTLAVGVGWSEAEFAALGQGFADRGRRTDEILDVLRAAWGPDPVAYHGEFYDFAGLKIQPKPGRRIPIWVGGVSEPAYRRAAERGDGFHAITCPPEEAPALVARIRRDHPDPQTFPFSLRTGWDPQNMPADEIRRQRDGYAEVGVQHLLAAIYQRDTESWLRSVETLAAILGLPA